MITVHNGAIGFDKTIGSLDDEGTVLTIRRGIFGLREITIPVSRITMVGWKEYAIGGGYIEFVAASTESRVFFAVRKWREFKALRDVINAKISQ